MTIRRPVRVLLPVALLALLVPATRGPVSAEAAVKPNILFILTDDQRADTMAVMPSTRANFNVNFTTAFAVDPWCCPSRASILTGEYPHQTGVLDNGPQGYKAFQARDSESLGPWLSQQGYYTGFVGKYFNQFGPKQVDTISVPPGWDEFYGYSGSGASGTDGDGYTDFFLRERWKQDGTVREEVIRYSNVYSTTVLGDIAERFIKRAKDPAFNPAGKPWALFVWTKAPHTPFTVEPKHSAAAVPTWKPAPSVLEADVSDKPIEVRQPVSAAVSWQEQQGTRSKQLRTLMSVDDLVTRLFTLLDAMQLRQNTWGIFSSDNGLFWGEHRLQGKWYGYEESIRVPLRMAIPGVTARQVSSLTANIDIAPTVMDIAGDPGRHAFEGISLVDLIQGAIPARASELLEAFPGDHLPTWFRYDGLRTARYKYLRWQSGNTELYDLSVDPFEMNNIARSQPSMVQRLQREVDRLKS